MLAILAFKCLSGSLLLHAGVGQKLEFRQYTDTRSPMMQSGFDYTLWYKQKAETRQWGPLMNFVDPLGSFNAALSNKTVQARQSSHA